MPRFIDKILISNSAPISTGMLEIVCDATGKVGVCVRAASGQVANLLDIQNSGGTSLLVVDENGSVGIGRSDPITCLNTHGAATTYDSKTGLFSITTPTLAAYYNSRLLFGIDNTTSASVGQGYIQMYEATTDSYANLLLNPNGGGVAIGTSFADTSLSVGNNGNTYLKLANTSGFGGAGGATPYAGLTFQVATPNYSVYQKGGIVFKTTEDGNGYARGQLRFLLNPTASNANVQDTVDTSTVLTCDYSGVVGIGVFSSISAKLHIVNTTEQLRIGYDSSNYYSTTVGSTGIVTFNAVGSGSKFVFSDNIELSQTVTTESVASDTTVTIVINGTTYKLLAAA